MQNSRTLFSSDVDYDEGLEVVIVSTLNPFEFSDELHIPYFTTFLTKIEEYFIDFSLV